MYKLKFYLSAVLTLSGCWQSLSAQDYFDDIRGSGNPISLNLSKTFNVSTRLNVGDNSLKANIFKLWRKKLVLAKAANRSKYDSLISNFDSVPFECLNRLANQNTKLGPGDEDFSCSDYFTSGKSTFKLYDIGLGTSIKGKTKDGLGSLFTGARLAPEAQWGVYGVWHYVNVFQDEHKATWVVSPFLNFVFSEYRLLPDTGVSYKKLDTIMNTVAYGLSVFRKSYINKKSQVILGASITRSKLNTWDKLSKVELKETRQRVEPSDGTTGTLTTVEDKGYTYGLGMLQEYNNVNLRVHFSLLPYRLDYRVALVFYPSIDFNNQYDDPGYNLGFGIHFLEKGNPTMSVAGIFFELNDINNSKAKEETFLKRSFKVGVTTALNVTSLIKKEK
jgi:hypothetical protein